MRQLRRFLAASAAVCGAGFAFAGVIDNSLANELAAARPDQQVSTLVYMAEQVDLGALQADLEARRAPLAVCHEEVIAALQRLAVATQRDLLAQLDSSASSGAALSYQAFWIVNAVRVDATPAMIHQIAARADVGTVFPNYVIEMIAPVASAIDASPPQIASAPEAGLVAINAPQVWQNLGLRGEGILVSSIDTGVQGGHPALASRWAGVADAQYAGHPEWAWWDGIGNSTFPYDSGSHGTHTMGTITGGPPGDSIGVAPAAHWISAMPNFNGSISTFVAQTIEAFQWIVDPDGDPGTTFDVPAVCSNSWGLADFHGYEDCDPTFWSYIDACEAAGVAIIFAAGNEGTDGLRRPSDRAISDYNVCAVAAVDGNVGGWPIADFSSRGPTFCTLGGGAFIKPNVAAPGVNVRSSVPNNQYGNSSGTSMAAPHIAGVIALLRQACPDLPVYKLKQALYLTARDLGNAGKDNSYGWGMVDAYAAAQYVLAQCAPSCPADLDDDGVVGQSDLGILLGNFGCTSNCVGDVDGDGDVDQSDLGTLLPQFGQVCP